MSTTNTEDAMRWGRPSMVTCPRCKGINSDRCEQGGQACVECEGKGKVPADYERNVWNTP